MKIVFHTLGCKVNQYETQAMRRLLEAEGFETGEFVPGDDADPAILAREAETLRGIADQAGR